MVQAEDGADGISPFFVPRLSVKIDSAFLNYNVRDWLQVRAGLLFHPHLLAHPPLSVDDAHGR